MLICLKKRGTILIGVIKRSGIETDVVNFAGAEVVAFGSVRLSMRIFI